MERLIVFARYPTPGFAKTRLIPALGAEGAAKLQGRLTEHVLKTANEIQSVRSIDVEMRFTGSSQQEMQDRFGSINTSFVPQCEGDLGTRLQHAAKAAFDAGIKKVVIVGTDCPDIDAKYLIQAFDALNQSDVVLGPAFDGGYTLMGLKAPLPELFSGIEWGTNKVLSTTRERCKAMKRKVHLLGPYSDVDHPEDLIVCRRHHVVFDDVLATTTPGAISIVIPTLNELAYLEDTLTHIVGMAKDSIEIIVADGGSTDGTLAIAKRMGVRVVSTAKGRGRQMNAGAALASGEVILFLHADTRLPADFVDQVWQVMRKQVVAGAFRLRIDGGSMAFRIVEWGTNIRSRVRKIPYGDQAIFVRAKDFYRLCGFRHWPLMEDYEFCGRVRSQGGLAIASAEVSTSSRRWKRLGTLRTTLRNQCCILAYHCGISIERIAAIYSNGLRGPGRNRHV